MSKSQKLITHHSSLITHHFLSVFHGHDLHGRVAHFVQKTVDNRAVQKDVPTRARGLAEDNVRYPGATRELNERVGDTALAVCFETDDLRAEVFGKAYVLFERSVIFGLDAPHLF